MLADKKFREGVAVVDRLGLSYDVSLYHTQISEVADLASTLPNTRSLTTKTRRPCASMPLPPSI
jgi:predicted TIM-barrel fold metal-dependent hydrolase